MERKEKENGKRGKTRKKGEIKRKRRKKKNKADRLANSRECWAGALMEVRSHFGLNSAIKKTRYGRTDRPTDRQTLI
jgi:hypothetical protein